MHAALREHAAAQLAHDAAPDRTFVFNAPTEARSLVFSFHRLARPESPKAVKEAVESLHKQLQNIGGSDVDVVGVMPHFHARAHEGGGGPSPGTFPRPVYPDQVPGGWRSRFYQPIDPALDLADSVAKAPPVPVAVLDVRPDLKHAQDAGERLRKAGHNAQLGETVEWLLRHTPTDAPYEREFNALAPGHEAAAAALAGEPPPYPIPDHGLFIAGLIHGIAPQAPLSLEPVLEESGVGDLSLVLLGLQRVLRDKAERDPQIINLSLGFMPHPARLPATWYGLERPYDAEYVRTEELFDREHDQRWVAAHRGDVGNVLDLFQTGLSELARYLRLNNCLVIAAAGNDSLSLVEANQPRMEPRLPARFDTVLGVAATTSNPEQAAAYSNIGDERELGDHVATFGGDVGNGLQPEDGVIGIYAGKFPFKRPNETGWAFWSGTSFATGIVSGIAANYWAHRRTQDPNLDAADILAELSAQASSFGPYVPALRTPAIEVQGRWRS